MMRLFLKIKSPVKRRNWRQLKINFNNHVHNNSSNKKKTEMICLVKSLKEAIITMSCLIWASKMNKKFLLRLLRALYLLIEV